MESDNMKKNVNVSGKKYSGEEIKRETVCEGHAEKQVRVTGGLFTAVPYWHRHDVIKFKLESGEIMTYHEKFNNDELHERYIDYDYYMTTEEYKKERDRFMNS